MADLAKITSLDALEAFRAALIIFVTKARRSVDELSEEVHRTRSWIQTQQRVHWETQLRKRQKMFDQANQELISARFSEFKDSVQMQQMAVRKAKALVEEAEEKMRKVKIWSRDFDRYAEPMSKKVEALRSVLEHDMPKAIQYLVQVQRTLDAYTERFAPLEESTPLPESEPPTAPLP